MRIGRKDAQIHVLVTTQSTGSRGAEYSMMFKGLNEFEGPDTELKYVSSNAILYN